MTGAELVTLALKDLNEISGDEVAETQELADGFATLNEIISSWSNEELPTFERRHTVFTYTADDDSYTMGTGGDWVTAARPMRILSAESYSGKFRRGMTCLPMAQFRAQVNTGTGVTATLPDTLGYDNARPSINVRVFPTPNATSSIEVDYWVALTQLANSGTTVDFAEGWEQALRDELVIRLAPMYSREATQTQIRNAQVSKANISAIAGSAAAAAAPAPAGQ
jgi:hypothetical protein